MKNVVTKLLMLIPIFLVCVISYELAIQVKTSHIFAYLVLALLSVLAWFGIMNMLPVLVEE